MLLSLGGVEAQGHCPIGIIEEKLGFVEDSCEAQKDVPGPTLAGQGISVAEERRKGKRPGVAAPSVVEARAHEREVTTDGLARVEANPSAAADHGLEGGRARPQALPRCLRPVEPEKPFRLHDLAAIPGYGTFPGVLRKEAEVCACVEQRGSAEPRTQAQSDLQAPSTVRDPSEGKVIPPVSFEAHLTHALVPTSVNEIVLAGVDE